MPVTRQVRSGDLSRTLEPRVLQVLIALARANGEAITRDDLIEWCWGGRIVSDDAINRVLSLIRRLAADFGEGSFTVETIPRVGYRLTVTAEQEKTAGTRRKSPWTGSLLNRRAAIAGAIVLFAGSSSIGFGVLQRSRNRSPEAQELLDRTVAIFLSQRIEDYPQAIAYMTEATRLEPDDPELLGALALAFAGGRYTAPVSEQAGYIDRAKDAAMQALERDPDEVRANRTIMALTPTFGNWAELDQRSSRMIKARPNHPLAVGTRADILMEMGRWREAEPLLVRKRRILPFDFPVASDLILARWSSGNLRGADETVAEASRIWPRERLIWDTRIVYLAETGRTAEALSVFDDRSNRPVPYLEEELAAERAFITAKIDKSPETVADTTDRFLQLLNGNPRWIFGTMETVASIGNVEVAADLVRGVYLGEGPWKSIMGANGWDDPPARVLFGPQLRLMRSHPVFEAAIRKIGLEDYWRSTGTQPDYRRFG